MFKQYTVYAMSSILVIGALVVSLMPAQSVEAATSRVGTALSKLPPQIYVYTYPYMKPASIANPNQQGFRLAIPRFSVVKSQLLGGRK